MLPRAARATYNYGTAHHPYIQENNVYIGLGTLLLIVILIVLFA
jgi:hypothetical protein